MPSYAEVKERDEKLKEIALALFERCAGECLTVAEYMKVLEYMQDALKYKVIVRR